MCYLNSRSTTPTKERACTTQFQTPLSPTSSSYLAMHCMVNVHVVRSAGYICCNSTLVNTTIILNVWGFGSQGSKTADISSTTPVHHLYMSASGKQGLATVRVRGKVKTNNYPGLGLAGMHNCIVEEIPCTEHILLFWQPQHLHTWLYHNWLSLFTRVTSKATPITYLYAREETANGNTREAVWSRK